VRGQRRFAADDVQRRSPLEPAFGQQQRAAVEVERGEPDPCPGGFAPASFHWSRPAIIRCTQEEIAIEAEDDAFAKATQADDAAAVNVGQRRLDAAPAGTVERATR